MQNQMKKKLGAHYKTVVIYVCEGHLTAWDAGVQGLNIIRNRDLGRLEVMAVVSGVEDPTR